MPFVMTQKVLFKHCDPAGIGFFPRLFEMVNDCVEAFFDEALGWPFEEFVGREGVPTAEIHTRFAAPVRHGEILQLSLAVLRVGRSSLGYRLDARCETALRFQTEARLVHVNGAGRPAPWPDAVAQRLAELTETAA
ncbi:MAG: hotdog domain-containing protein [Paracoccaceae bacterium]